MLSLINNLYSVARLSGNTSFVITPCNIDPVSGLLAGSAVAGGLLSGILGASSTSSANNKNLQIMREQMRFNALEAQKQRAWQEKMQNLYGTSSAKANNLRAAGLNAKLGDVSASSIGSGASASASSAPVMQAYNPGSDIAQGINSAVDSYLSGFNAETQRRSQDSQKSVNDSIVALNDSVQKLNFKKVDLTEEGMRQMRLNNDFLRDTFSSRVRQQFTQERIAVWNEQDVKYSAIGQRFGVMNVMPAQVQMLQSQSAYFQANMLKAFADGLLTLKDVEYYQKNFALRQTMATAQMISARAQETSANAAMMNAKEYSKLLRSQRTSQDIKNEYDRYANDFWLGRLPPESIAKSVPLRPLLQSTLDLNIYTAEKMRLEPKLVEALTHNYNVQSDLFNSESRYYDWKKWSDAANAGSNFIRSVSGSAGTFAGSAAKAFFK